MKKRILLSMLAMILAFAQVWAAPVDSLRINPRTTNLPNKWNGVELTEGNSDLLVNGMKPLSDLNVVDVTGHTTSSDSWSSIPNSLTFRTKVGKPVTYTFTLSYCTYAPLGLFHTYPKARLKDETGMFSIDDEKYTYVTEHEVFNFIYDNPRKTCIHFKREVTVTYTPTETGTHSAKIKKLQFYDCANGPINTSYKDIELVGTAIDPSISVSPSSLTFNDATVGKTYTKSLVVFGHDLSWADNLMVSSSNSNFTVSPKTITAADAEAGKIVTVYYTPSATGTHTGTITIYGGGAEKKTVSVKGTCTTPATPTINTSVTAFTFGTVIKGYTATRTFTVTGSNLTGSLAVSSNNSNFTVSPATLPASGGTVTVTYKPTAVGSHSTKIYISGGGAASKTVTATGICVVPNIISTVSSLAFGTVVKGNYATKTFTVTGTNLTGSLTLSSSNSNFTVSPSMITAADAAAGKTVTVTYKPTAAGSHSGTITISGGGATNKTVSVTGTCVNPPTITVNGSSLDFGTVVKNNYATKTFTVTATSLTGNLTVTSSNSYFTVSPTTLPANGGSVIVTYKPTAVGSHSATITISCGATSKSFTVTGTCIDPKITTSVSSLAFGTVVKDKQKSLTFKVTGTDLTGGLTVSSSNSTLFTVSPTSITAAEAKAGKTVTVTYKPTAAGSHSATITVKGGGASPKTVSVTGTCVVPTITVSETSLLFAGYNDTRTLTVKGTNLTGSLTLSTNNSYFSVSPTTITVAEAKAGKTVLVHCNAGLNTQRATGILTISGGGAAPKKVSLSYVADGPVPYAPMVLPDEEEAEDEWNGGELQITQDVFGNSVANVNELVMDVKIYADGGDIVIETPVEQSAVISDIAGRARRVNLQAGRNVIPGNTGGVHIIRVGEKTAKLMLR